MDKGKNILEVKRIHKGFRNNSGELKVLYDISLTVRAGEIIALVGPSGCGKTTLLNMVAGLIEPDRGALARDVDLRLAYVFQEPRLLPWKTVEENISFVQDNFLSVVEAKKTRESLLQKTGLNEYKDVYPAQLSGGMKQRLEIVRALSIKPRLLLMDEPFKSLDLALKLQLQKLIMAEQVKDKFAVLFITHDPEEAVMLADRVVVLSDKPTKIQREIVVDMPDEERNRSSTLIYEKSEEILGYLLGRV
ncbi:MAG: ATP-binding cassette domain-containing protein [Firmicutes bacterium]|nr:ATP-binding cassette domain-containing protein [Bacillota bacterium]